MIRVEGMATVKARYVAVLQITQEEFDNLSETKQNQLLDESIDWQDTMRSAEIDEIDVWDIYDV